MQWSETNVPPTQSMVQVSVFVIAYDPQCEVAETSEWISQCCCVISLMDFTNSET